MISTLLRSLFFVVFLVAVVLSAGVGRAQSSTSSSSSTQSDSSGLPDAPLGSSSSSSLAGQDEPSHRLLHVMPVRPGDGSPRASVLVSEETMIRVRTDTPLNTRMARPGMAVDCIVSEDVAVGDVVAIPRGAIVHAQVMKSKKAGRLTGAPELILELVSLDLEGRSYPLYTYQFDVKGTSKTKPTLNNIKGGAVIGALTGGLVSGSAKGGATETSRAAGMGTGAGLGAGAGTLVSAVMPGPLASIPAEAQVDFYLAAPIALQPVSAEEVARLATKIHGGPSLYVRDENR